MKSNFEWSAPAARFEIFGVPCEVEVGDVETVDRIEKVSAKLRRFDVEKARSDNKMALAMSGELRAVVRAVVGDEAAAKVFKGRKPNIAMEASMIAFIFEQVNAANASADGAVAESVSRIAALSKPVGDEE